MYCLYCGDCCKRMNPFGDFPCKHLIEKGTFFFCGIYEKRPEQCRNHEFHAHYCPVGVDVLKLESPQRVAQRIDEGWELSKNV